MLLEGWGSGLSDFFPHTVLYFLNMMRGNGTLGRIESNGYMHLFVVNIRPCHDLMAFYIADCPMDSLHINAFRYFHACY